MEIHAPGRHVQSFGEVALHLAIVTAGILIALSLEQTVEWYHHRQLVAEARETILNEVRFNKKELDTQVSRLPRFRTNTVEVLDFVTDILDRGKSDRHNLHLAFSEARLQNTSWATAQTVGAIAFMPYAEVGRYASVYRTQEDYLETQKRTQDVGVPAFSVFAPRNKLEKLSHPELEAERARLMNLISSLTLEMQIAGALNRSYDRLLSGKTESPSPTAPPPAAPGKKE
jgi:cell division protein FtsL